MTYVSFTLTFLRRRLFVECYPNSRIDQSTLTNEVSGAEEWGTGLGYGHPPAPNFDGCPWGVGIPRRASEEVTLSPEDLRDPPIKRRYKALTLDLKRRWDRVFCIRGAHTLSKSYGNYERDCA